MQLAKPSSRRKITSLSPKPQKELLAVWLPRELVEKVRSEAHAGKRPTSRQVEFFLEKVLVTPPPPLKKQQIVS